MISNYEKCCFVGTYDLLLSPKRNENIFYALRLHLPSNPLALVCNPHKNRAIFASDTKASIDAMVTYLNSVTTGNIIAKTSIPNWDKVVTEKAAFLAMVKTAGFNNLGEFNEYFGLKEGQLDYFNILMGNGFGELPIELVKSFHKAHRTISANYNTSAEDGEWGGSYSYKYDGMHFGLKSSFIRALTNK